MTIVWIFLAAVPTIVVAKGIGTVVMDLLMYHSLDRSEERLTQAMTELVLKLREPPRRKQDWSPREDPALWR